MSSRNKRAEEFNKFEQGSNIFDLYTQFATVVILYMYFRAVVGRGFGICHECLPSSRVICILENPELGVQFIE